jgi:thiamine monophosphate kinase
MNARGASARRVRIDPALFHARQPALAPAESGVILGIGDDAAVLALPPGTELIAAVDTIVAGAISCRARMRAPSAIVRWPST